jgi:hypothetical protein
LYCQQTLFLVLRADLFDYFFISFFLSELEYNGNNNNNNNNNNNYNNGNNNNNGNYNPNKSYYVGATCSSSDGKSINLQVFSDQYCSVRAANSIYAEMNYGVELPFSKEPIIAAGECVSCMSSDNDNNNNNNNNNGYNGYNGYNGNNNNNNNNNAEPTELCENSYEQAARCETNMDVYYPDTSGCEYINSILPRLTNASRKSGSGGGGGAAAVGFAWLFGISTIVFGSYAYFLYRKIKRGTVNLSAKDGDLA